MNKKIYCLIAFLLFYVQIDGKGRYSRNHRVIEITIYAAPQLSQTELSIDCDKFHELFKGNIKTKTFKKASDIEKIVSYYKQSVVDTTTMEGIDTRSKILFVYSNGTQDSVCINKLGYMVNRGTIKKLLSDDLLLFIDSLNRGHLSNKER